jgi:hypothetical protein
MKARAKVHSFLEKSLQKQKEKSRKLAGFKYTKIKNKKKTFFCM